MKDFRCLIVMLPVFLIMVSDAACGQPWNFIKEKDGIKIYTRNEANSSLKSYKGETTFRADTDKLSLMIGNSSHLEWWDKNISGIKVLTYEENKFSQFYFIYKLPWPLADRDLAVDARISSDPVTGDKIIFSKPLLNVIPEKPNLVRIRKYWQKWTIQKQNKGYVHLTLEGFVDPGGNVPPWVYNMIITETPLKVIRAIRERYDR